MPTITQQLGVLRKNQQKQPTKPHERVELAQKRGQTWTPIPNFCMTLLTDLNLS